MDRYFVLNEKKITQETMEMFGLDRIYLPVRKGKIYKLLKFSTSYSPHLAIIFYNLQYRDEYSMRQKEDTVNNSWKLPASWFVEVKEEDLDIIKILYE